ncbi:MAG TPA: SGNH/GDSL hydrolase family protein [Anaerolineales bacterium]|nr:SGNH/GDSL hydrolase family protein [Anaerolineales bacterium]
MSASRGKETRLKILVALAGPLVMLALIEGAAFLWERGQANGPYAWELVASRRIELVEYPDPAPGYTLMAPGERYEWGGIAVEINALGLRSPETTREKPTGTLRILNLGDSIAMGWGVAYEATYGQLIEGALSAGTGPETRVEVINAGVPGWNLENELAYLLAEGLAFSPDAVVLDLTLVNDIYGRSALERNPRPAWIEWLRANTYLYPFLSIQMQWLAARAEGQDRIPVIDPPTEARSYFPLDPEAEKWDELWSLIVEMHLAASGEGVPLILVMFPLEYQVVDPDFATTPQEVLLDRAAAAGIPIIDLLPVFREACAGKPGEACELEDRYLFADVWMHPSVEGHRLTAEALLPVLLEILDSAPE